MSSRPQRIWCPACGCDVTPRVRDCVATHRSKRLNSAEVNRVARLLDNAEAVFLKDSRVLSNGALWKADVRAIRYVFNRLIAETGADHRGAAPGSPIRPTERNRP